MNFIYHLKTEVASTLEALTGVSPFLECEEVDDKKFKKEFKETVILKTGFGYVIVTPEFASFWTDLMLAGEGEIIHELTEDIIDGARETISNILGSLKTALEADVTPYPALTTEVKINKTFPVKPNYFHYLCDIKALDKVTTIGFIINPEFIQASVKPLLTQEEIDELLKVVDEFEETNDEFLYTALVKLDNIKGLLKNAKLTGTVENPGIFIPLYKAQKSILDLKEIISELEKRIKESK